MQGLAVRLVLALSPALLLSACPRSRPAKGPNAAALPAPRVQILPGSGPDPAPMVLVEAGPFPRGSAAGQGEDDERPQRLIHLSAFALDRFAVSVAQYRKCVQASACSVPDGEKLCTYPMPDHDTHPVNCVSWDQASAYCKWAGKRLPTEAEWEKAARGTDARIFPWGQQDPNCSLANFALGNERYCRSQTVPVGDCASSASPYGAVQMAGNVFAWVADWHDREYYRVSPERDPTGPVLGKYRVVRGGSWFSPAVDLRATMRGLIPPAVRLNYVGFRCAKDVR
jgi:formylglycine-generating enzyme required for sulfatase activity